MWEIYWMLGRSHEADLAREADEWRLADEVRHGPRRPSPSALGPRRPLGPRLFSLVARLVRPATA